MIRPREPRYGDSVLIATQPRRYGPLTGTIIAELPKPSDTQAEFAVVLDAPRIDGVCVLVPVPASRLVVLPK